MRVITAQQIQERLKNIYGDRIILEELSYQKISKRANFIDKDFGLFDAIPDNVLRERTGHPKRKEIKTKQTCLQKYGVETILNTEQVREKCKKSRERSIDEIKNKIKILFGDSVVLDETTFIDMKSHAKFIDKDFGIWVSTPASVLQGHRSLQRSVKLNGESRRLTEDQINQRIRKNHKETIIVDYSTYINNTTSSRFVDEQLGEFWAQASNVLHRGDGHPLRKPDKQRQTFLQNYGVDNPLQSPEVVCKVFKNWSKITTLNHWKDDRKLLCRGTYEIAVVEWLNKNKIDFNWQIPFKMSNRRTYYIDLYLLKENKYAEIKGVFRDWDPTDAARQKWNWFHKEYPNSELWDTEKLKQLGLWTRILYLQKQARNKKVEDIPNEKLVGI